jgi:hypothetical protein
MQLQMSGTIDLHHTTVPKKMESRAFMPLIRCISALSPDILFLLRWCRSIVPEIQGHTASAATPSELEMQL